MKGRKIRSSVIALVLAAALTPAAMAFGAQHQNSGTQQKQSQQQARTYFGTIVKLRNGRYALLINPKGQKGYFLDDQKDAKKYVQKQVLIKGMINAKTGMLHVLSIKPASH